MTLWPGRLILRGDRLLDIGCGDGAYTIRLAGGFNRVDAIDVQAGPLALFADRIEGSLAARCITIAEMSAAKLDYPDDTFDLVTSIEVLEHITELDQALKEIGRVLKPGGRFAFTTPNRWFPFETHGVIYRGRRYAPARAPFVTWIAPLHRRLADARTFTSTELRERLITAGLSTRSVDYIMPPFDRSFGPAHPGYYGLGRANPTSTLRDGTGCYRRETSLKSAGSWRDPARQKQGPCHGVLIPPAFRRRIAGLSL